MIFGVDISHYQAGIDLNRVRAEGFDFVICKVSQGSSYRDTDWPRFRDAARRAGLLLAGYHYIDTSPAAAQAATCFQHLGDPSIPVMVDWEAAGGNWANCMAVVSALRARGLRVPLGYFPRWYWQQQGSPNMSAFDGWLVSSRYPSTAAGPASVLYQGVTDAHWGAYGGLTPTILQFSDKAMVAGMQIDADVFRGTRNQLAELLGGSPDMDARQAAQLDNVLGQLTGSAEPGKYPGYTAWGGGTGENLTVVDYLRRSNVEVRQAWLEIHAVREELAKLQTAGVDLDLLAAKVADVIAARLAK